MANLKELSDSRTALLWFDPTRLSIKPGLNGRDMADPENVAHIEALAASIQENGFLQSKPLELYLEGESIFVTDGQCRWTAVMLLRERGVVLDKIPCVVEARGTNDADRILNQNIHNSGKRLTPLEEGRNMKRALALGKTVAEIAAKLGKSLTYVNQAIDFQSAPAEVHAAVVAGEISATLAAATVRAEGNEAGAKAIKEAVQAAKAKGKAKATAKDVTPRTKPVAAPEPAPSAPYAPDDGEPGGASWSAPFQARAVEWAVECFGVSTCCDATTRGNRFFEEAAELYQASGATIADAHALVDYVFGRPIGEAKQEAGGVMLTLATLCAALGFEMTVAGEIELARVNVNIEAIRAKAASKTLPGPLPVDSAFAN